MILLLLPTFKLKLENHSALPAIWENPNEKDDRLDFNLHGL
jgi:hypothetical protein